MAYKAFKPEYFKKMAMAASKGQPVSFAFGKGKQGDALILDSELMPKELFQKVKTETGATKGSWGTCTIAGSIFMLIPETKVAGMKKSIKELAKAEKWKWKDCKLLRADGSEDDDSDDGAPADSGQSAAPGARGFVKPDGSAETPPSSSASGTLPDKVQIQNYALRAMKGLRVWEKTTETTTKEIRSLQLAILKVKSPHASAVVRGLEKAMKAIGNFSTEAAAVRKAAVDSNPESFVKARDQLIQKLRTLAQFVEADELLKDLESNPIQKVTTRQQFKRALAALEKSLKA